MDVYAKVRAGDYDTKLYGADRKAWREDEARLVELFHKDIAEEFGLTGHPKEEKLFGIAWSQGHAYGLNEVYIHYSELSELLK